MNLVSKAISHPLHIGVGIVIATYTLAFFYVLLFSGEVDARPIGRGVLSILLAWGVFSGRRWADWTLAVLSAIWTVEQLMWGIRGYPDSFLFAILLATGSVFVFLFMAGPVQRDDAA